MPVPPGELAIPHFPYVSGVCLDIADEPPSVFAHMSYMARVHVQYLIWADENGDSTFASDEYVAGPWLDQQTNNGGWQSLGVHTLQGRVRIEVRDTRTRDDYRYVGLANASLAVDAIRLRNVHR